MRILCFLICAAFSPFALFAQPNFWQQTSGPFGYRIQTLAINSRGHIFAGTNGGGIFRSMDNGDNWIPSNAGLANNFILRLAINSHDDIFAGTVDGIFRSTNNGESWVPINAGLTNTNVNSLAIDSSGYILAGTFMGGIFRSTSNGDSWLRIGWPELYTYSLAISPNGHIFAATNCCRMAGITLGNIFRSVDGGERWTRVYEDPPLPSGSWVTLLAINARGHIFAVTTTNGIIRSTDDGESWVKVNNGLTNIVILCLAINSREHIFAGTNGNGVFRSTDQGENWTAINSGLTNTQIESIAIDSNDYVFVGTDSGGVFRSVQPTTSVRETTHDTPISFSLEQNYPNPFNPSTTIQFSLLHFSYVTLKVYNTLGEEVATLVAKNLAAGRHQVTWNAGEAADGVYLYRLQVGNFVRTRKLVVIK